MKIPLPGFYFALRPERFRRHVQERLLQERGRYRAGVDLQT